MGDLRERREEGKEGNYRVENRRMVIGVMRGKKLLKVLGKVVRSLRGRC